MSVLRAFDPLKGRTNIHFGVLFANSQNRCNQLVITDVTKDLAGKPFLLIYIQGEQHLASELSVHCVEGNTYRLVRLQYGEDNAPVSGPGIAGGIGPFEPGGVTYEL